jgi:hypothetical protein
MIYAGLLTFCLASSGSALAQRVQMIYPAAGVLPPQEIIMIVRSTGYRPLSPPVLKGFTYRLRAADPVGHAVRVVVDARLGRIVRVARLKDPRFAAPILPPVVRPPVRAAAAPVAPSAAAPPPVTTGALPPPPAGPALSSAAEKPAAAPARRPTFAAAAPTRAAPPVAANAGVAATASGQAAPTVEAHE